ncbi:MAG: SH3 domain-containing protein, partial [Bacteroidetes bacterium]
LLQGKKPKFRIMTQNRKGLLSKIETAVIFLLFLAAIMVIFKKCQAMESRFEESVPAVAADSVATPTTPPPAATTPAPTPAPTTQSKADYLKYTRLYVTINNLKLRKSPGLNGEVITQLPLFEEVWFLNEVTDSTQKINLGYQVADEPWVKIRTTRGHEGWVYGAGVSYYKRKHPGVLE